MKPFITTSLSILISTSAVFAANESHPAEWCDSLISLGEVQVTAIKERTDLESAPETVTVIDAATIDRLEILNVKQAAALVPNFYIPDYGSRMTSSIYVRGLGARIDQPVVGLNVDNVPVLNKDNYDFDLPDIDRMEMFRGPQSTLYGRNTMAGLINIYTLSPLRYEGVRAFMSYGSGNTVKATLGLYKRLAPTLGMALTGSFSHTDGFFRNEHDGKKVDHENHGSVRWKTEWRPSSRVSVSNTAALSVSRQGGYPYASAETGKINYNDPCFYHRTSFSDGLAVDHHWSSMKLSSITSVQYSDDNMTLDQDFMPESYFVLTQKRKEWTVTQDFVGRGQAGDYSWLGGLFGFYKKADMNAPVTFKEDGVANLIEAKANGNPKMPFRIVWGDREFPLNSDFKLPTYGLAVYHRSSYDLGRWTFSANLRLDYEHAGIDYHNYATTSYKLTGKTNPDQVVMSKDVEVEESDKLSQSFTQLLPKISVEYHADNADFFVSVAKGYKSGGYNTQMFSDVLQQSLMSSVGVAEAYDPDEIISYKPEKSWNYEAGASFRIPSARITGNAAVFFIDCRDQQLTVFPAGQTTGRRMTNAGRTRSTGAELSLTWTPSTRLSVNGSYGFTNAKFRRFIDGNENYAHNRVPYAPQNTMYASADYTLPLGSLMGEDCALTVHAGVRGVGSIYWDEANTLKQPFYALADASLTLDTGHVDVELKGENLADHSYDVFYFKSIGHSFVQRGAPRIVSASVRYKF